MSRSGEWAGENGGADEKDTSIQFRWMVAVSRPRRENRPRFTDDRSSVYYGIRGSKMLRTAATRQRDASDLGRTLVLPKAPIGPRRAAKIGRDEPPTPVSS